MRIGRARCCRSRKSTANGRSGAFAGPASRRRDGTLRGRLETEQGLGGRGALQPLVGSETDVVEEGQLEPLLQVVDGQGTKEPEPRICLSVRQNRSSLAVA